jgi:peptide/nickel transport system permease protein
VPNATPASVAAIANTLPPVGGVGRPAALARAWAGVGRDPGAVLAIAVLGIIVAAAIFAPVFAPYDPARQFDAALGARPPSAAHWLGTDPFSRDVLSRLMFGARVSLAVSAVAVLLSITVGTLYGAVAGYSGGRLDSLLMRGVDALISMPRILLLLGVLSLWGTLSASALILLIGITGWFGVSRLVRAEVAAVKDREFVEASRALGAGHRRLFVRHVLPHIGTPVLVAAALGVGNVVVVEAGLSFLGFGVPQPLASWGSMIRDGRDVMQSAWWLTLFPGLALVATVLAVNTLADRLRSALTPRQLPGG